MLIELVFLIAALKLLDATNNPTFATTLYTASVVFAALVAGGALVSVVIWSVISFCVALVYFSLLQKFESGPQYYSVLGIGGAFLLLVV